MKKRTQPATARATRTRAAARPPAAYQAEALLRPAFYETLVHTLEAARQNAYRAVNTTMVGAYWEVGRQIVEEEQHGSSRADYGTTLLQHLSLRLTADLGPGFTERNLRNFRQFYLCFPIRHTVCAESARIAIPDTSSHADTFPVNLRWSHYRLLIRIDDAAARGWYMHEAAAQNWSVRALERQIHSLYYQRLHGSANRAPVVQEMLARTADLPQQPRDLIRDPYVLEFLDLPDSHAWRESALEQAIVDKLQPFLLELGRGFAFVARQQRVTTETKDFFIDLVFYNFLLKCFVLVDLKVGELTHQDIGQMDMYVRLYEDRHKGPGDNPTVGLILCTSKDHTVVRYSVLHDSQQLFASTYQLYLPTEEELRLEVDRQRDDVLREQAAAYGDSRALGERAP